MSNTIGYVTLTDEQAISAGIQIATYTGAQGPQGEQGPQGAQGAPYKILGSAFVSVESLAAGVTSPLVGDLYNVGTSAPYNVYRWTGSAWEDQGIQGRAYVILGSAFDSVETLASGVTSPLVGDLYNVGSAAPYNIYRWTGNDWEDQGVYGQEATSPIDYDDDDIYGVEVDFRNSSFKRLSGASGMTAGASFDTVSCFGNRRRCIVTDTGVRLAYYGSDGYTETGELTQAIVSGGTTYPIGTRVQVMVEQPKFYYAVVPVEADKITRGSGLGYHLRKARYYVCMTPKRGFKIHPAFVHNGATDDYIYLSAYEGTLENVNGNTVLRSVADAQPRTTGAIDVQHGFTITRANARTYAHQRGSGWEQQTIQTSSLTQLLYAIEYCSMNMQTGIGVGITGMPSMNTNVSKNTGLTASLGNASGAVQVFLGRDLYYEDIYGSAVSYRGEENFYGNILTWVDGINVYNNGSGEAYIADHSFADDTSQSPYENAGISMANEDGYVSAFAYSKDFDWLFIPSETLGNSALPVGDRYRQAVDDSSGWSVCALGGHGLGDSDVGGFYYDVKEASDGYSSMTGARLTYIPSLNAD